MAASTAPADAPPPECWRGVRVLTVDATGTMLFHKDPVPEVYCREAARVGSTPPKVEAMKAGFKAAFKASLERSPCFGHGTGVSTRDWWHGTVREAFTNAGCTYPDMEFNRIFTRIWQHYGTVDGYTVFDDVLPFLEWASQRFCVGLLSNNFDRLADNTLPMLGLHEHLRFFVLSQQVGVEKPGAEIFARAREEASGVLGGAPVAPHEVLHIGDNFDADYCGARAAGLSAVMVSRAGVSQYQTWLTGPDFEGKGEEQVQTVTSLDGVRRKLEAVGAGAAESP